MRMTTRRRTAAATERTGKDWDPLLIALLKKVATTEKGWPGRSARSLVPHVRDEHVPNLRWRRRAGGNED